MRQDQDSRDCLEKLPMCCSSRQTVNLDIDITIHNLTLVIHNTSMPLMSYPLSSIVYQSH